MKPLQNYAVAAKQFATHPVEIYKLESTLNAGAAAGLFVQIHDSNQTPAEGAVPLKSWPALEASYKEFKNNSSLCLTQGLYVCLSTAAATKVTTGLGGSDIFDIIGVELIRAEDITGTTIAGDTTSSVASLLVFSNVVGNLAKRLYALEAKNNSGADGYLQLFAGAPTTGDKPILTIPVTNGTTIKKSFGQKGIETQLNTATPQYGCYLYASSTGPTFTAQTTWNIKAEYK